MNLGQKPSFVSHSPLSLSQICDTVSYFHYITSVLGVEISQQVLKTSSVSFHTTMTSRDQIEDLSLLGCDCLGSCSLLGLLDPGYDGTAVFQNVC